jgi:calcineurin-like phosphoesterase
MMPQKFIVASDDDWINGVVIEVDEETGKSSSIQRLNLKVDVNDKLI